MCLPRHGAEIKHPQPHHAPITRVGLATFHVGAALAAVSRSPQSRYIGRYSRHRFGNLVTGSFFFCASFAIGISGVWLLASAGPGLSHLPRCCLRGSFSPLRLSVILIYLSVLFCSVLSASARCSSFRQSFPHPRQAASNSPSSPFRAAYLISAINNASALFYLPAW